jgi:hypothetical protein
VTLYPLESDYKGLQLGPGVKATRRYSIDVFASNNAEKLLILDLIHNALHNNVIPVIDFNRTGYPLTHWGTINDRFIQDIEYKGNTYRSYLTLNPGNGSSIHFSNIKVISTSAPRESRSDILQHVGKVSFSTVTYTDRDPKLIGKFSNLEAPPGGFDSLIEFKKY